MSERCDSCGRTHAPDVSCPVPLLRLLDDVELAKLPEPEEDFEGRGIQAGGLEVGYGPSGCGKTTLYADRACCLATGKPWLGATALHRGRVLYFSLEGVSAFAKKIVGWKHKYDFPPDKVIGVYTAPDALNLLSDGGTLDLIRTAQSIDAREIIIDTAGRSTSAAEDNEDMGILVANCDQIRQVTRARVVLIHHSGKVRARGARGGSALTAAADCVLSLDVDQSGTSHLLKCEKLRDGRAFDPIVLKLVPTADRKSALFERAEGEPSSLADGVLRLQSQVLKYVREHPALKAADIIKGMGRQKSAVLHALGELAMAGKIEHVRDGRSEKWSVNV